MNRKKWTRIQQARFLDNLSVLLDKGYSLSDSLRLLELQFKGQARYPIKDIRIELQKGIPIVDVLAKQNVPSDILGYLYFATEYGSLTRGLREGSEMLRKRENLKKAFYQKIRYPLVLLTILFVMMFFMVHILFPQFTSMFLSVDLSLPFMTRMLILLFDSFPLILYMLLTVTTLGGIYAYFAFLKRSPYERFRWLLKFPLCNTPIQTFLTHYFAVQTGHLLKGGLSVSQAMQLFVEQHYLRFFQVEAEWMTTQLRNGEVFSEILADRPFYLPELSQVVLFGQANGRLGEELLLYSDMLFERTDEQIQRHLALIQPIFFGAIGLLVLVLFLSVMLPIFKLFQSL
jgi:competence protein ComGB